MLESKILVLDEPVSALDVSIQAHILNLLTEIQERLNLACLFISHDLSVVHHIVDEIMVMYLGVLVEFASRDRIFAKANHPYTQALLFATPVANPFKEKNRIILRGELPSAMNPLAGSTSHSRCPHTKDICRSTISAIRKVSDTMITCYGR